MLLSELKSALQSSPDAAVHVMLPSGEFVPAHFHITEVGRVQKDFLDCGGTRRAETRCVLQAWVADDVDHRITAGRLGQILALGDELFRELDPPVGVEYDAGLVSEFPLGGVEVTPSGLLLNLGLRATECLAPQLCGVPAAAELGAGCC